MRFEELTEGKVIAEGSTMSFAVTAKHPTTVTVDVVIMAGHHSKVPVGQIAWNAALWEYGYYAPPSIILGSNHMVEIAGVIDALNASVPWNQPNDAPEVVKPVRAEGKDAQKPSD